MNKKLVLNLEEIALVIKSSNDGWVLLRKSELDQIKEQERQEVFDFLNARNVEYLGKDKKNYYVIISKKSWEEAKEKFGVK